MQTRSQIKNSQDILNIEVMIDEIKLLLWIIFNLKIGIMTRHIKA